MLSLIDVDLLNNEVKDAIAQWAINVVDFRDADSIMTPFEYDANPYNGWITDGNLQTDELGDRPYASSNC